MGVHMDGTDIRVKEKMEVGVAEKQAASPIPAIVVENWRNHVVIYVHEYFRHLLQLRSSPLCPSPSIPVIACLRHPCFIPFLDQ